MGELERTDEPPEESVIAGLPLFASYYTGEDGRPIDAVLLYGGFVCEECGILKADVVGSADGDTSWAFIQAARPVYDLYGLGFYRSLLANIPEYRHEVNFVANGSRICTAD